MPRYAVTFNVIVFVEAGDEDAAQMAAEKALGTLDFERDDIDADISNAWCVVTHVSAAALDALRLGIPVVTTGQCAATPLSIKIQDIDNPIFVDGRDELFSLLACGQFTPEEMLNQNVLAAVRSIAALSK